MTYMQNIPAWKRQRKQDPSFDPKPVKVKETKKLTEKELIALTKTEQIDMILKLKFSGIIPKYEADRVKLILKLQK